MGVLLIDGGVSVVLVAGRRERPATGACFLSWLSWGSGRSPDFS
jgi:hypothetical protein